MDRFKFRAWDKKLKRMDNAFYIFAASGIGCTVSNDTFYPLIDLAGEDLIVMQSTGLKDKNEKLIYEGDILAHKFTPDDDGAVSPVIWDAVFGSWAAYRLRVEGGAYGSIPTQCFCNSEIIGNIYENPELLDQEKPDS